MSRPRVAVVIPALNEAEALPTVLAAMPTFIDDVVVADNGSTDGTPELAHAGGAMVVHEGRRGYGAACLAALRHLENHEPTPGIIVFIDADGSERTEDMARLVAPIVDGEADMVLGVRRGSDGVGTILPHARAGNWIVLGLCTLLFGRSFSDLPPFRAISFESLRALQMDDQNWGWTLQMQIRAHRMGLRIREIEVPHQRRTLGRSKISGSLVMSVRVGAKMFWTLARERLRSTR